MKSPSTHIRQTFTDWFLDGPDWEAGYFISEKEYDLWMKRSRNLNNMLLDSARSAGLNSPGGCKNDMMPATIPGCDRSILLENHIIADPFYGRNLEMSSWSEQRSWAFRKVFRIPEELKNARQLRLHFNGIDYKAMIFLNNEYLGQHFGMFIPVDIDVTRILNRTGENCLTLVFEPAPQGLPNHQDEQPADFADFHRIQSGFGWDWSRKIVPTGIWDSVYLRPSRTARIKDFQWRTRGSRMILQLDLETMESWEGELKLELTPENFTGKSFQSRKILKLPFGSSSITWEEELEDIRQWYPAGYGFPALYRLTLEMDDCRRQQLVGFRDLTMTRNPGSPEGAYNLTFTVNGQPILVRGGCWAPSTLLPSQIRSEDYEQLVRCALTAHFNLFRVWGGGLIEKDSFYEWCDRCGIIVWQEFPHACSNYRKDNEYLGIKSREAEGIIRRLRNHASVMLFCGGNEVQYYGEIPESPLYRMYETLVNKLAPDTVFHTSSPDASRPGERPHGPWDFREHEFYNRHFRQFVSEIGCNGLPETESMEKFLPPGDFPFGQSSRYHFMHLNGVYDIQRPLQKFQVSTMWEYSQASMFAQADAMGYFFEHYKREFPQNSGCLIWQYNETWPTCSFSIIDYYKTPKMAMYRLAESNAPRAFSIQDSSWCLTDGKFTGSLFFCSDLHGFNGEVTVDFWDCGGRLLQTFKICLQLEKGVHKITDFNYDFTGAEYGMILAVIRGQDDNGELRSTRIYGCPDFKQAFLLPKTTLATSCRRENGGLLLTLENTGSIPAMAVRARSDTDVYWKQNYAFIAPGEKVSYQAEYRNDFSSENNHITINGWNVNRKEIE